MKRPWDSILGHILAIVVLGSNLTGSSGQDTDHDEAPRSIQVSGVPVSKGGWRPVVGSTGLGNYNYLQGQTFPNGKIHNANLTPQESKMYPGSVGASSLSGELYPGSVLSTSARPHMVRDSNKITSIAQTYKPTNLYSQSNVNLNAPVNSYLNPFSPNGNGNMNPMKLTQNLQKDMRYQQGYRPMTKYQAQMKRIKQNQLQAAMMQQLASGHYHQTIQTSYHGSLKKPFDGYHKPDLFLQQHHKSHDKPQTSQQVTKAKQQTVQVSTYKPPLNTHFQQYGLKEESFAPIPSSILGTFSSFGHASVKAREPIKNSAKSNYAQPTPTKQPVFSFNSSPTSSSSAVSIFHSSTKNPFSNDGNKFGLSNSGFITNLYPPPRQPSDGKIKEQKNKNADKNKNVGTFYPSPQDLQIIKGQKTTANPLDKPNQTKYFFSISSLPKQQSYASTPTSPSTFDPFDSQSTNVVPENLLVQLPPPYLHQQKPKVEIEVTKENIQTYLSNVPPIKYNNNYEFKYIPSYNPSQATTPKSVVPFRATYEVTETWGNSGEAHTQPTLHSWFNPAQSFKQYNTILRPNSPPPPSIYQDIRLVPTSFLPPPEKPEIKPYSVRPTVPDIKTKDKTKESEYSTSNYKESDYNNDFFSQLENSLSSTADTEVETHKPVEIVTTKESFIPDPYSIDDLEFLNRTTPVTEVATTIRYDSTSTLLKNKRRRPIQPYETTEFLIPDDDDAEITTVRYETYREHTYETENDLRVGPLPTLPPNRHFKRPSPQQSSSVQPTQAHSDGEKRKRLKLRRRRPVRPSSTTEWGTSPATTDNPMEDATKYKRPQMRFPVMKKPRPTKPTAVFQTETTSSAQPTIAPTTPMIPKKRPISNFPNRPRPTTMIPEEPKIEEDSTMKLKPFEISGKESSIMKIAKDSHRTQTRTSTTPVNEFDINEAPDYTHKQDEKDTPTSDIAVNTSSEDFTPVKFETDDAKPLPESDISKFSEFFESTATTVTEQTLTTAINDLAKDIQVEKMTNEMDNGENATEATSTMANNKTPRARNKGTKYDNNRPRFSVKDYRNRLSQYTSSTTTEKTNDQISTRIRFPSRRFPNFKDNSDVEIIPSASEIEISTEVPRKKFIPKEPRHKSTSTTVDEEVSETPPTEKPVKRIRTTTFAFETDENEVITPRSRLRNSPRRDQSRIKTTTEEPKEKQQKISNAYANVKRLNGSAIRKKGQNGEDLSYNIVQDEPTRNESSTERQKSETSIMKIRKEEKKHVVAEDLDKASSEQSKRVSDLTLAASKDYNTPGLFKTVSPTSRRIPNYFTIATDDPILPIEAFFPQLNQKKES